jgi:hypothetical protein
MISWDEERLPRETLLTAISRAGFEPQGSGE